MTRWSKRARRVELLLCGVLAAVLSVPDPGQAQEVDACRVAGPVDPATVVARALDVMGAHGPGVLHHEAVGTWTMDFQSDRTYPPYFAAMETTDTWYDPSTGVQSTAVSMVFPGGGPPARVAFTDARSTWVLRGETLTEVPGLDHQQRSHRDMNPWAVLRDWSQAGAVRVVGLCAYRDDDRLVLERNVAGGPERLFLDVESGFPVKRDRVVPDGTWGQRHEEVLWSTWLAVAPGSYMPSASFVLLDGEVNRQRTVGTASMEEAADPALPALPAEARGVAPVDVLGDREAMHPDTVRVGDDAFVLAHRMYNSAVVAVGDTVWVLDATLNQARAQEDAAWIKAVHPEARHVVVVVTDLAWPHVGGVRWWVSQGATIMAHATAEPFLRSLVERRWTLDPDALEQARAGGAVPFRFVPVEDELDVARGRIGVRQIEGIGSEGALMVFDRASRFLWAGDWIQDTRAPSMYASEVTAAVARYGLLPTSYAAQHVPVGDWSDMVRLNPVR